MGTPGRTEPRLSGGGGGVRLGFKRFQTRGLGGAVLGKFGWNDVRMRKEIGSMFVVWFMFHPKYVPYNLPAALYGGFLVV